MIFTPGRKVVTRSPHRRVGYVSCPWFQGAQIQYESLLELSFVRIAMLCPTVRSIESQPFKLELGNGAFYTPDFLLECDQAQRVVVEVKPMAFVSKHRQKLLAAKHVLERHGFDFHLATDEEIHLDDRHDRAAVMLRYARSSESEALVRSSRESLDRLRFPISAQRLSGSLGVEVHDIRGLIGRRALFLLPSLHEDNVFDHQTYRESEYGRLSSSAWLRCADW